MPNLHIVSDDAAPAASPGPTVFPVKLVLQWCIAILAAFVLGSCRPVSGSCLKPWTAA